MAGSCLIVYIKNSNVGLLWRTNTADPLRLYTKFFHDQNVCSSMLFCWSLFYPLLYQVDLLDWM